MNKERRSKSLVIVALALTLMVLTLGFAAFSTTLNISSNATVTPNEEDFKITIYGLKDSETAKIFAETSTFEESDLSTTISAPYLRDADETSAENAIITNSSHTISNISVGLKKTGYEVIYYFIIKNEGKYDAYLDLTEYDYNEATNEYILNPLVTGTCTPEEGTTASLVEATCASVIQALGVIEQNEENNSLGDSILTIEKEKYIVVASVIGYIDAETLADGPFTVKFPTLNLNFSTTK